VCILEKTEKFAGDYSCLSLNFNPKKTRFFPPAKRHNYYVDKNSKESYNVRAGIYVCDIFSESEVITNGKSIR